MKKHAARWSWALWAAVGACALSACTPDEEKITRVFQSAIEECKKGSGDFAPVELFGGAKEQVLRQACDEPLGKVTIQDGLTASAPMGPYLWLAGTNPESGTWVLRGISWDALSSAKRLVELKDKEPEDLDRAEQELASAQQAMPAGSWIRIQRLKNHLERQAVRRRKEADPGPDIGAESRAYLEETLAWAKERADADAAAQARLLVLDYLRRYQSVTQDGLDALGSGDAHLERVILQAKTDKDKDTERKYTEELAKERAERPARQEKLEARLTAIKAAMCAEVASMAPDQLKDEALKQRVIDAKALPCP